MKAITELLQSMQNRDTAVFIASVCGALLIGDPSVTMGVALVYTLDLVIYLFSFLNKDE